MANMEEKTSDKPLWIFPDTQGLPMQGQFIDCVDEISSKTASSFPVIKLDDAGRVLIVSKWKTDYKACIKKYGGDSDNWKGKMFEINKHPTNKGLILLPIEEDIKR